MIINLGSENLVKIGAVVETLKEYPLFSNAEVKSLKVNSNVSAQPKSLEEVINGAINRSKNCFNGCKYSFGLESGLMHVPKSKTGYMDICACSISDGEDNYLGLSSAFEFPTLVMNLIETNNVEANDAFYLSGLTKKKKIGSEEGAIGLLTNGRITRKDYTKQAIHMALIRLINKELYK